MTQKINDDGNGGARPELAKPICSVGSITLADLVRIHNAGYHRGHHDTVEAGYADIHRDDEATYHEEEVSELLAEMGIVMSNDDDPTPKAGRDY